ncbi:MAG: PhzF family phenazine biosynthesis protein [Saprospiraceae bacterium]
MELTIYQVDAFTNQRFKGNPAAVVPLNEWLPDAVLQDIAQENNLAETAYFVQEDDGFRLRWFTPAVEVDLCGHATVATAHVLYEHLGYNKDVIKFQSRSGLLTVEKRGTQYLLNFPTDHITKVENAPHLVEALGTAPVELYQGKTDWMVVLEEQSQVENLKPDLRKIAEAGGRGTIVTAPGIEVDFVSRCFFPQSGVDEDPVTGSAHTTLTPYWAKRLGKNKLHAKQISKRSGDLTLQLKGDRTEIGGEAVTYLVGKIFI